MHIVGSSLSHSNITLNQGSSSRTLNLGSAKFLVPNETKIPPIHNENLINLPK